MAMGGIARRYRRQFIAQLPEYVQLVSAQMSANVGLVNLVVTSPRDDSILQARRLMNEVSEPSHLVLNMTKSLVDRTETGVSVVLPYNETWAQSSDPRLADPILELFYIIIKPALKRPRPFALRYVIKLLQDRWVYAGLAPSLERFVS